LSEGRRHIFTATTDFTLANPTNIADFNGAVEIIITQGLGGGHQIAAKGDKVIFPNGVIPTLNGTFGQSDWLRGIAANGFLLIYQIESLNAPGIQLPPAEPIEPTAKDLVMLSFYKESQNVFAEAARQNDLAQFDIVNLQGYYDSNKLYNDLKESPLFQFSYLRTWKDQSGNNHDAIAANNLYPYIGGEAKNLYQWNLRANNFENLRIASSNILQNRSHVTLFWVMSSDDKNAGRFYFNVVGPGGFAFANIEVVSGKMRFRCRRLNADSFTEINIDFFTKSLISLDVNFATGDVVLRKNGVIEGSSTLASTGNSQNNNSIIAFDKGAGASSGLDNAQYALFYFGIAENLSTSEREARESALMARYLPTGTRTGADIYDLFDVIVSPDRYGHSPYAAQIRRASDNATNVISHSDTTGFFDEDAFDTFIGASSGFVSNVRNQPRPFEGFTQATAARQLQLVKNIFNGRVAFQGNRAQRRSLHLEKLINVSALKYSFFLVVNLPSYSGGNNLDSIFALYSGTTERLIVAAQIPSGSTGVRLRVTHNFSGTSTTNFSTNVFDTGVNYLITIQVDYSIGVMEARMNGNLWIQNTALPIVSSVNSANLWAINNLVDNNTNSSNAIVGGLFFAQGEMTTAQRVAIEQELINQFLPI